MLTVTFKVLCYNSFLCFINMIIHLISSGELKLSIQYTRGELHVMIQHGRDLIAGGSSTTSVNNTAAELPSPYVKTYLLPDMHKVSKRKTRVIRRNIHPTFMEMLVYRMSLENVQKRLLQVDFLKMNYLNKKKARCSTFMGYLSQLLTFFSISRCPFGVTTVSKKTSSSARSTFPLSLSVSQKNMWPGIRWGIFTVCNR